MLPRTRETWLAALALVALLAAFFERPLRHWDSAVWSTADLTQNSDLTSVGTSHSPINRLLSDPPFQMQPWQLLGYEELRAGRWPLWNPYNGGGQPLFANYQASLLSPFNWPMLIWPYGKALAISALSKLLALGFFTFLLLRTLKLAVPAAAVGALAFTFCGHNVFTLAYPHPGALVVLPAGLYCVERAIAAWSAIELGNAPPRSHWPWLLGLAAACGVGALAGHPEPFFFAGLLLIGWTLCRLATLFWQRRKAPARRAPVLGLGAAIAAAAVIGIGLAAVQILPFLEYLEHSSANFNRKHNLQPFELGQLPLLAYPDLLGNPSTPVWPAPQLPGPNYEGANMLHAGALVLVCGLLGLFLGRRRPLVWWLSAVIALWFLYGYDIAGLASWSSHLPLLRDAPINRSQPIPLFCLALLAAVGVDQLLRSTVGPKPGQRWSLCALALISGLGLWLLLRFGAEGLLKARMPALGDPQIIGAFAEAHMRRIDLSLLMGLLGLVGLGLARAPLLRGFSVGLLALAIFFQNGWIHRNYNPTIDEALFFPQTESMSRLAERTAGELVAIIGSVPIQAENNAPYRIAMLANYDALSDPEHDLALAMLCDASEVAKNPRSIDGRGLRLFGARYVLHPGDWPLVDSENAHFLRHGGERGRIKKLEPGQVLTQTWRASRSGLQAAMATMLIPFNMPGKLTLTLEAVESGAELARLEFPTGRSPEQDRPGDRELILAFEPQLDSMGKHYRLRMSGEGLDPERLPRWIHLESARPEQGRLSSGGQAIEGMLRGDLSYGWSNLERVAKLESQTLQRYSPGLGRYFVVEAWQRCKDRNALRAALTSPDWDPYRTVLFEGDAGPTEAPPGDGAAAQEVKPSKELPCRVELEVERDRPGLLVIARSHLPGWRARVNGVELPLWQANLAFSALPLGPGKSRIELTYMPRSVQLGATLSASSLLLLVGLGLLARRGRSAEKFPIRA